MLFNEPKLLKSLGRSHQLIAIGSFSALQRAEIAEIWEGGEVDPEKDCFSALQRAEIAEIIEACRLEEYRSRFQCSSTSRNC